MSKIVMISVKIVIAIMMTMMICIMTEALDWCWGGAHKVTPTSHWPHLHLLIILSIMIIYVTIM